LLEILTQQLQQSLLVFHRLIAELKVPLDDQPADLLGSGEIHNLLGVVWVDSMVEHQDGETWMSAGCVIEKVFAGNHQETIVPRDFALGVPNQFLELWNPRTADRQPRECRQRRSNDLTLGDVRVVEPLMTPHVECPRKCHRHRQHRGERHYFPSGPLPQPIVESYDRVSEKYDEQRPDGIARTPDLL